MNVIGVMGRKQSGKSEVAGVLARDYGFYIVSFADPIREMLYNLNPLLSSGRRLADYVDDNGWDAAKQFSPEVRRLLQYLGTEAGRRVLGEDVWVDAAVRRIKSLEKTNPGLPGVVVPDVRFPNEGFAIHFNLGGRIVHVERPTLGADDDQHASEYAWRDIPGDYLIINDGTLEDLAHKVGNVMTHG